MTQEKRRNTSRIRGVVALAVFLVVGVVGVSLGGAGSLSSIGWSDISIICPLGSLEALFGTGAFIPRVIIALVGMVVIVLVFGKAFCGWVCPVPWVDKFLLSKNRATQRKQQQQESAERSLACWKGCAEKSGHPTFDSRHVVLGGTLLSAGIFGFPVFCMVCPVGLTFATFALVWRLFTANEPTWGLIIFPLIIVLELVFLRRWCHTFCPISALMSLVAKFNKSTRPKVNESVCLRTTEGVGCAACSSACPEYIDPVGNLGKRDVSECVRCNRCADACPAKAISFPFLQKQDKQ
jgi:ferredoxin-type protein NapH